MTTTFANNFPTKNKTEKFTEKMAKKTKLSETEIDRLVQIFKRITVFCANYVSVTQIHLQKDSRYSPNKMSRKTFRAFLNETFAFTDDIIMDRLFKHFNRISCDDIDTEEWVSGFSIFLKGSKT